MTDAIGETTHLTWTPKGASLPAHFRTEPTSVHYDPEGT